MNTLTRSLATFLTVAVLSSTAAATDVGVSVNISQPGFYGRIDIGRAPQPVLIYTQPVIIEHRAMPVMRQPIYLRVPPGHEKNWAKHCRKYSACGQPVYFVQDSWYREVYAPRYYGESPYRGEPPRRADQREDRRDDRRDNGRHGHKKDKENRGNN